MDEKTMMLSCDQCGPRAALIEAPAKLSASTGAEDAVISKQGWEELRRMHQAGQSVSGIARSTGLDRKTVRRALRHSQWQGYRRAPLEKTVLSEHLPWLRERAPQVRYSARILFQELRAQHGYQGGYDTVKNAVRPLRTEAAVASLTECRFETAPGHQAQVDWGQVRVQFTAGPAQVHVFVMTLGYSRRSWAEGYTNERMDSLLSAHEHAFEHFGGRPEEVLYDRMRTVILGSTEGKPRWNPSFEAFAKHWGFEPRVCRAYRAQTKGKVESGVKYIKGNFLPGRAFGDLEDFNAQLRAWLHQIADVRVHGTTHERPIDRFAREAALLARSAAQPSFFQALQRDRVVGPDWLVAIDSNRYSVPWRLIGKTVQVMRVGAQWHIRHRGELIAEHAVLAGRHQLSVQPEHGPGASARNARTRFSAPSPIATSTPLAMIGPVQVRDLALYEQVLEVA